jgi:hypothetical protein
VTGRVIEGAFEVLDRFSAVGEHVEGMKALAISEGEQRVRAGGPGTALRTSQPTPITEHQLLDARRPEDRGRSLAHLQPGPERT